MAGIIVHCTIFIEQNVIVWFDISKCKNFVTHFIVWIGLFGLFVFVIAIFLVLFKFQQVNCN